MLTDPSQLNSFQDLLKQEGSLKLPPWGLPGTAPMSWKLELILWWPKDPFGVETTIKVCYRKCGVFQWTLQLQTFSHPDLISNMNKNHLPQSPSLFFIPTPSAHQPGRWRWCQYITCASCIGSCKAAQLEQVPALGLRALGMRSQWLWHTCLRCPNQAPSGSCH